ncbi:MAG: NAD-dependent epimerase/dehydratase family protein [Gaiellaceae bacterium]
MDVTADLAGRRVAVTGGAGFVGSRIVARLIAAGADVVVLDDFSTGSRANLPESTPSLKVVDGSVLDLELVQQVLRGCDVVIHAAARNIVLSTKNPRDDYAVNIGGTLNVLLAARDLRLSRIVYTSSCSIYGNPRYLPIAEEDAVNLLSPYAVSKFGGEGYCHAFYESYSLPTAVVRYSNVFGLGQTPENPYCGVVAKFFQAAMTNEPLQIHGDGEQTRDYTFVEDAVTATLSVAVSPRAIGQVYNVGTGRETSVNRLAQLIAEITEASVEPRHVDRRDIDNIRRRVVNIEKIRRELRWEPEVTVEQGLRETYAWLRERGLARV